MEQKKELIIQDKKSKDFNFYRCDSLDADVEYLRAYYGLNEQFSCDQLVTQDTSLMNRVMYITKELSQFLYADTEKHLLNLVSVGTTIFSKNHSKVSSNSECIFRLSQDGLRFISPQIKKRHVITSDEASFKRIMMYHHHALTQIPCE